MEQTQRVWIDTLTVSKMSYPLTNLQRIIDAGHVLVCTNTMLDVKTFQQSTVWLEERLSEKSIVIEIWSTPDEMTSQDLYWFSSQIGTKAAPSFQEAISELPNKEKILKLKKLLEEYGIPKGEWEQGQWNLPRDVHEVAQNSIRTEVLENCKDSEMFDAYNRSYNQGLAVLHMCDAILNMDGTVTAI